MIKKKRGPAGSQESIKLPNTKDPIYRKHGNSRRNFHCFSKRLHPARGFSRRDRYSTRQIERRAFRRAPEGTKESFGGAGARSTWKADGREHSIRRIGPGNNIGKSAAVTAAATLLPCSQSDRQLFCLLCHLLILFP